MFQKNKYLFGLLVAICSYSPLFSQDALTVLAQGNDLDVLYRNEMNIGVLAHPNGVGINYRRCRHISGTKKGIVEFEFVNMRSPKEVKISNPNFDNSKGFIYGKLNAFQIFRPGVGYQKVLFPKAERKSVEIRLGTYIGASIGFVKPVYLVVVNSAVNGTDNTMSIEKYDPQKHFIDNIYGRAPYFKGFGETKIYPGGYAKLALSFEYADYHNAVKAIETGITVDAFPKTIPIMALNKNQQVFVSLYLSFIYGKKWF